MPADARQRLARLRQPVARIVALEALVAHELLRVVRPPVLSGRGLRKRIQADPDAADLSRRPPHEQAVHVVAGRHFVRRDVGERRVVELLQPRVLALGRPVRLRVGDVVVALDRMRLERRRRVHRRQAQIERRRRRDDDALAVRQVDEPPLADEREQLVDGLLRRRREFAALRMIVRGRRARRRAADVSATSARPARPSRRTPPAHLLQLALADRQQRRRRRVDQLLGAVPRLDVGRADRVAHRSPCGSTFVSSSVA